MVTAPIGASDLIGTFTSPGDINDTLASLAGVPVKSKCPHLRAANLPCPYYGCIEGVEGFMLKVWFADGEITYRRVPGIAPYTVLWAVWP